MIVYLQYYVEANNRFIPVNKQIAREEKLMMDKRVHCDALKRLSLDYLLTGKLIPRLFVQMVCSIVLQCQSVFLILEAKH